MLLIALFWISALENGQQAFRVQNWPAAERYFSQALRDQPSNAQVHKWLGMTYAAQQKYALAEAPFRRACELDARDPDTCYYYGRTLFVLGRLEPSLGAFEKARQTATKLGRVYLGLALSHEKLNHWEQAERYFRQALAAGERQAAVDYARFQRQPRPPSAVSGDIRFDVRELPFTVRNGAEGKRHLPETMIGGAAVLDFDNDGWPDLFLANGASLPALAKGPEFRNGLLRNRGDGTFEDVTLRAGLSGEGYSMGAAAGDYDNDGFTDLLVTGLDGVRLYRNHTDGSFAPVELPAVKGWSVAALWLDYDRDGWLDLFIVRYVVWNAAAEPVCGFGDVRQYCHPKHYTGLSNVLLRNRGNGAFEDVSASAGLSAHMGKGMGVAAGDYNNDGWLDIFVSNDTVPNFLFRNTGEGRFVEAALEANVALNENGVPVSSMGADFRDLNNDGWDDLIVTALTNETYPLFRNERGLFRDVTLESGLARASLPYTGWGVAAVDLDNDGWKDLVTANGHVMDNAEVTSGRKSRQPSQVYHNAGGRAFAPKTVTGEAFHRGLVWADFDRDGRLDIVITRLNQPALILWNRTETAGSWLGVRLRGRQSNRQGIGARVIATAGSARQWNRLMPASGYGGSSEPAVYFGLGQAESADVEIEWPSGRRRRLSGLTAGAVHTVDEE